MASEFKETAPLKIAAMIVIPILTFLGGMGMQYWISERALAFQRFTTASNLLLNETAQKNKELKEWSEMVILRYTKETNQVEPPKAAKPPVPDPALASKSMYWITDVIVDDVCLVPREARKLELPP